VTVRLYSSPTATGRQRFRIKGGEKTATGVVAPGKSRSVTIELCTARAPQDLLVRSSGKAELPGGKVVGLAITRVAVKRTGRCRASA
jgi:hypothetical protein